MFEVQIQHQIKL